MEEVLVTPG